MVCEAVQKITDDAEVRIMQRAVDEGLSPQYARALFNIRRYMGINFLNEIKWYIQGLGFEYQSDERPDCSLHPGMDCLSKEFGCEQYSNDKGTIILMSDMLRNKGQLAVANINNEKVKGFLLAGNLRATMRVGLSYMGPKEVLDELGLEYLPSECPHSEDGCKNEKEILGIVSNIADSFYMLPDDEAYGKYEKIVKEEEGMFKEEEGKIRETCKKSEKPCAACKAGTFFALRR